MIVEVTLCALCVGSLAVYIAYVASKITPNYDPVLFEGRKVQEVRAPLVFYSCCDPWGKHK